MLPESRNLTLLKVALHDSSFVKFFVGDDADDDVDADDDEDDENVDVEF